MRCAPVSLLLLLLGCGAARAQPADPAWSPAWDSLVQTVCTDAQDRPLPGATPLGPCPRPRKLRANERLPYHKRDWPGLADQAAHPSGYQQSDSVPIETALGPAVLQTYDFGDDGRTFGRMDQGDGGQVVFFTPNSASVGVTEDGGAGLQLFLGAACTPVDSWVIVDRTAFTRPDGETLARLTRRAYRCAAHHLNPAFTRWWHAPVEYRTSSAGVTRLVTLATLVSEHFDGTEPSASRAMERMYFTQPLGYTRWEAWRSDAPGRTMDPVTAARLADSGRCRAAVSPPAAGWRMVDCREWTQLVPPDSLAGDAPFVWLDRLRRAPETAWLFGARR